jgi:hypothetical protein
MLTPHRSKWGTCILQTWTPNFNSSKPVGLKVPTWVTLKEVRGEFLGVADQIAADLGEVVGSDKRNAYCTDPSFCVALTSGEGYRSQLSVTNECTGLVSIVDVDYGNLPIKCRFCASLAHLVKDCPAISENRKDGKERSEAKSGSRAGTSQKESDTVLPPAPPLKPEDNPKMFGDAESSSIDGKANSKQTRNGNDKVQQPGVVSDTSKAVEETWETVRSKKDKQRTR